ncbi:MAG: 16S rRNA (uracil(1498)-N(3))-methyltransferase [Prevotella sp.]|nr:16S rRNA (uracil(1498)-N(3))-methyltransferase [Prevotella sp.]
MKEQRFFYTPELSARIRVGTEGLLSEEESRHALRVLRLTEGDMLTLMDGRGTFCEATMTGSEHHRLRYAIQNVRTLQPEWNGHLHLAIAPTKMMERVEWLAEKATEIGFDRLSLLDCRFSERHLVKTERIERIIVAAVKQSRKAWVPQVGGMTAFAQFVGNNQHGRRYIAHCYDEIPRTELYDLLMAEPVGSDERISVLVGPEGDFSFDEVKQALDAGFVSVSLGSSRLRTETAGLMAVTMMRLAARNS